MNSTASGGVLKARVAHVVPTDRIAYLLLRNRLARLCEAGFEVAVICGDGGYGGRLRACGLEVLHIPFAREIDPFVDLRCCRSLYATLRRRQFDIVHTHNPKGGLLGPIVARLAGVPVVAHTVHGFLFNENSCGFRNLLAHGAERWTAWWCDHLLFQSVEDHLYAKAHRFKREGELHLVGNGIDPKLFDPARYRPLRRDQRGELGFDSSHVVVGTVGRFVREKGFVEFFQMAARLAQEREEVRFLIAGLTEREQSDALDPRALIAELGIGDRCVLLEPPNVTPEIYACMDLFVLASYREGLSRSLLEAGAMALPVVASDIRGCREIVEDGRSGLLFPLKSVDSLVSAVRVLIDDNSRRRSMGFTGRQNVVENYTEDLTCSRVSACYDKMLAGQGR